MLTLAFSLKHSCTQIQPHRTASMAVHCCLVTIQIKCVFKFFFIFCHFSRLTTRSSIGHMKSQTHLHAALKSWLSRNTFKAHTRHSVMKTKWLCNSSPLMMSLTKTLNVPPHQPEGHPWQNISTTTEPMG